MSVLLAARALGRVSCGLAQADREGEWPGTCRGDTMTYEIRTEIGIDAPPARVWEVLADFPDYPDWNPFILEVQGEVRQDSMIKYRFEFPRGIRIWAAANILRFEPDKELRWAAHFLTPGTFNGEHYFLIEPVSAASVVFHHGEIFSGVTLSVIRPLLSIYGMPIYQRLNRALKQRVESRR
jgi:hypothetical protein